MRRAFVVNAGETTKANLGQTGRLVTGRFFVPFAHAAFAWGQKTDDTYFLHTAPVKRISYPSFKTVPEFEAWSKKQPLPAADLRSRLYFIQCAADGTFHIDHVEPGKYDLTVSILNPTNRYEPMDPSHPEDGMKANLLAACHRTIEISADPAHPRAPLDLGTIELSAHPDPAEW